MFSSKSFGYRGTKGSVDMCQGKVNPKMKDTVEAKELEDMYLRGELKLYS